MAKGYIVFYKKLENCGVCKLVQPQLDATGFHYNIATVEEDEAVLIAEGIKSVPTIVLYNEESEEVARVSGVVTEEVIRAMAEGYDLYE
ncbi:putative thioredoxin [Listeria phage LP-032]|uniref:Thioredoxin domain-containing protein n=10 Tax=Homburgvirus TaxID=1921125 RepID=A0A5A4K6R5_9CAUD|nr:putative thioredoxin [Listeria phage LP-110]YP_008240514.1 putative thioredoxin [Listeria phage LP-037]YP_009044124.1 putative thioredoxin [Listeria phage LP-026]YP_009045095.1 putative thioredoxin [Listeria phage LP-114]AHL18859.1 putative thioredoxin [Listeria phage LP-032]AWY07700.1 hypothetical protein [Listeria phage LP-KV022]QDK04563.1 hypothetical protein FK481_0049 [Listeria phage LP-010]QDK04672.1 hypothetical protein FK482_0050 [Listeria phage LP-013]QDK04782.1 hypothetical pro